MRKRFKLHFWAGTAVLACLLNIFCGCHAVEAPRYEELVKVWKPLRVYHAGGDGSHIVLVQSVTNGIEYGKYIWPQFSSFGPGGDSFTLSGWRGPNGTSLIELGPKEGLGSVFDYTRPGAQGTMAPESAPAR